MGDPRPFRWAHGLILAIFAVLGVLAARLGDAGFFSQVSSIASLGQAWAKLPRWLVEAELPARRVECGFVSFLVAFSPGVGLATLRPSGRRVRGRLPGPGAAATAAAVVAILLETAVNVAGVASNKLWNQLGQLRTFWITSPVYWHNSFYRLDVEARVTEAILGVWAFLLVAGWHPRDDWRDRLGRWLGWCWLSTIGFHILALAIWR